MSIQLENECVFDSNFIIGRSTPFYRRRFRPYVPAYRVFRNEFEFDVNFGCIRNGPRMHPATFALVSRVKLVISSFPKRCCGVHGVALPFVVYPKYTCFGFVFFFYSLPVVDDFPSSNSNKGFLELSAKLIKLRLIRSVRLLRICRVGVSYGNLYYYYFFDIM